MDLSRLTVRALRSEYQSQVGFDLAVEKTKDNGIDEIFFEYQGQKYVAYDEDQVNIADLKSIQHGATWSGQPIRLLHLNDEHNHWTEKTFNTAKNVVFSALPDGIGGAAAGAIVAKIGLSSNMMKTAAIAGFATAALKEAVSVAISDLHKYQNPDWINLQRFTELAPAEVIPNTAPEPLNAQPSPGKSIHQVGAELARKAS